MTRRSSHDTPTRMWFISLLLLRTYAHAEFSYSCAEDPSAAPVIVKIDDRGQLSFGTGITTIVNDNGCRPAGKGGQVYRVVSGMAFIFLRVPNEAYVGEAQVKMTAAIHGVNGMGPACSPHRLLCTRRD